MGSKIGGRIDRVLVQEGDAVQPGQVLISFDDKELQASLEQSRANAEKARRGYRPEEIAEARAVAAQAKAEYELKKNGYYQHFPPQGVEIVSWYVMMGIGQVVTLRLPAERLREVNRVIEETAWGPYRTEFYPTYDYKPIAEQERAKAP